MTDKLRAAAQAVERLKPFVHGLGKSILEELKDALAQQDATCKQNLQVWVQPSGAFSWEPQDERFWVRMVPNVPSQQDARQDVDWEKLYRLEVKKKEALAAKYERDIKPLTKIVPLAQTAQQDDTAKPASEADMAVYRGIAANYHKDRSALAQQDAQHTELSEPENKLLDTLNDLTAELEETRTALAKMVRCSKTMNLQQCADASQHAEAVLAKRPYLAPPEGDVVVTFNESMTRILFVTRQDEEGRIIKVIAEAPAQQDAQAVPQGWRAKILAEVVSIEVHAKEVGYAKGGGKLAHDDADQQLSAAWERLQAMLNAAPTPPAQRVMLTDDEIELASMKGDGTHSGFARAVIEAYERKNGISQPGYTAPDMGSQGASQFRAGHDAAQSEIAELEQENRLLRARNDRLQKEIEQKGER